MQDSNLVLIAASAACLLLNMGFEPLGAFIASTFARASEDGEGAASTHRRTPRRGSVGARGRSLTTLG